MRFREDKAVRLDNGLAVSKGELLMIAWRWNDKVKPEYEFDLGNKEETVMAALPMITLDIFLNALRRGGRAKVEEIPAYKTKSGVKESPWHIYSINAIYADDSNDSYNRCEIIRKALYFITEGKAVELFELGECTMLMPLYEGGASVTIKTSDLLLGS